MDFSQRDAGCGIEADVLYFAILVRVSDVALDLSAVHSSDSGQTVDHFVDVHRMGWFESVGDQGDGGEGSIGDVCINAAHAAFGGDQRIM